MTPFETFLSEALPPLGLHPAAFRRRGVRRRVTRRMESLGIHDYLAYLRFLRGAPSERDALRSVLTVTISRFYRNRVAWETLSREVLLPLAGRKRPVRAWSAGCASGEEAYSLGIAWEELPGRKPPISVLASEVDSACLRRAAEGVYSESSIREVPRQVAERYFRKENGRFRLSAKVILSVELRRHDLLREEPPGRFDIVLCRNAAFTYFHPPRRIEVARRIAACLPTGGVLMLGRTEKLPAEAGAWFSPLSLSANIHARRPLAPPGP